MAVPELGVLFATVSVLFTAKVVGGIGIPLPNLPQMPKMDGKVGGNYKCIHIVNASECSDVDEAVIHAENITFIKEDGFTALMSGYGYSTIELCNGKPLSVRGIVYTYVEGVGWQQLREYFRNDVCPDINIAPAALEHAKRYSVGETGPHNPPWQAGHYAWANVPACVKITRVSQLPYRRLKGKGQLIIDKKVVACGEGEIEIAPNVGTEKYGIIYI